MDIQYAYQKKRSEFGRQCIFSDQGPDIINNILPNKKLLQQYVSKDPVDRSAQCSAVQAEHYLNTTRAEYSNVAMNHVEGGWPKDVNMQDEEQTKRYRRKVERDESFNHTILHLCKNMENSILQNNAINIYQQYFSDVEPTPQVERNSARTVNVYQDQCTVRRPITHISWSPDNFTKLAISHCNLKFQDMMPNQSTHSYIWEVENPNQPLIVLKPETSIVCLEYNPKDPHSLVSGQLNGQVGVWDIRRSSEPIELSVMEHSHRDPVQNVLWINSKSGTEFFSSSTDGQAKWWDLRKLSEPYETLILDAVREEDQKLENALGASCLEYETTIPTRFMVGTEQGIVISCNRKGKTALEKMVTRFQAHFGPVLALQRNPGFLKNFLTIGDWSARIFSEDCRESSIMWTPFNAALLTDGAWSPTRLSAFFTTRSDGKIDIWDILQQQDSPCLSVKICDDPLRCLRTQETGRLVAIGNQKGATYLIELSENLSMCNKNDKAMLTAMFERESHREKILEVRNREIRLKMKTKTSQTVIDEEQELVEKSAEDLFKDQHVQHAEADFYEVIRKETAPEEPPPTEDQEVLDIVPVEEETTTEVESPPPPTPEPEEKPKQVEKKKKKKKKKA